MSNSDLNIVVPTEKQLGLWDDTRAAVMWHAPEFTHVLYTLMRKSEWVAVFTDSTHEVPVAATDGFSVVVNTTKTGFFRYNLMERVFIVCHEILHCILNHIILLYHLTRTGKVILSTGKVLPFDEYFMQQALDYVINAILVQSNIGQMPKGALFDLKIANHMESVLDVYEKLYNMAIKIPVGGTGAPTDPQNATPQSGKPGKSKGKSKGKSDSEISTAPPEGQDGSAADGGFDVHLKPGAVDDKNPHQASEERNEAEWQTVIKAALDLARARGTLPGALEYVLGKAIETKIDWADIVKSWFARKVGSGTMDWRKPDRKLIVRDIWAPARSGFGCDLVVLGNDTSGSIYAVPKVMDQWYGVIGEVLEQLRPKRLIVVWCDQSIGRVDELDDMSEVEHLRKHGVPGGGGTSFEPVFQYIWDERLEPDALVYLTDGYGTFPKQAPNYPVFWGSIALEASKYPFGEVVMLPKVE